jgi:hypothetical protein
MMYQHPGRVCSTFDVLAASSECCCRKFVQNEAAGGDSRLALLSPDVF